MESFAFNRLYLRFFPVALSISLLFGQFLQSIHDLFLLVLAALIALIAWFSKSAARKLLFPVLLGAISFQHLRAAPPEVDLLPNRSYLMRVAERPRHFKVGQVSHLFELYIIDSGLYKPSGVRVGCRGKDLPWENEALLEEGDFAFINGRFKKIAFNYNPFSYEQRLFRRGISYECKLTHVSLPLKRESLLQRARSGLTSEVKAILGNNERAGLFLSMTFGVPDSLSIESEKAFKNTGMAHLLVVSGYQISIIYVTVFTLFVSLLVRLPNLYLYIPVKLSAAVFSFAVTLIYALVVGLETSVVRAVAAALIFVVGSLIERGRGPFVQLAISFAVLQLIFPLSIFEPGVQLTYAALLGLALGGVGGGPAAALRASIFASFLTSLVSFAWFGNFSWLGLILNPLFAPLISVISCNLGFLSILLLECGIDKQGIVLQAVAWALYCFRDLIVWLAG